MGWISNFFDRNKLWGYHYKNYTTIRLYSNFKWKLMRLFCFGLHCYSCQQLRIAQSYRLLWPVRHFGQYGYLGQHKEFRSGHGSEWQLVVSLYWVLVRTGLSQKFRIDRDIVPVCLIASLSANIGNSCGHTGWEVGVLLYLEIGLGLDLSWLNSYSLVLVRSLFASFRLWWLFT